MHSEYESRGLYTHVSSHVFMSLPALPDSYKGLSRRDGCDRHLGLSLSRSVFRIAVDLPVVLECLGSWKPHCRDCLGLSRFQSQVYQG